MQRVRRAANIPESTIMKSRLLLGAAALCMAPSLAFAQEAGRSNPSETIVVIGQRPADYSPADASSGTRIDAPLLETPLSVRVVDATVIADRAISEPRELAETVAGVQNVAGYGNTPSQWYIIRGFSTAGVNYRDGYRSAEIYTPRDFANVERVEFVMGPQSVLYGQSQPAGAVNTITKTPFDGALTSAEVRLGSFETLRGSLDLNRSYGPLSFRLNAMAENADSYVDYEQTDAYLVAPSLRLQISDNIELLYSGEYQKTTIDGFSNGLPMALGVFDLPASATVSEPWARLENETISHRLEARIRLSDDWMFRQGFYDSQTDRVYQGVSPAFNQFDGTPLADYPIQYNAGPRDDQSNQVWQTELTGRFDTGPLKHNLLVGYEHFESRFDFAFYDQFGCDNLGNCFGGYTTTFSTGIPFPTGGFTGAFEDSSSAETNAFYVSDQIALGNLRVLAGLRRDEADVTSGSDSASTEATTGRLGLLYLLTPRTSVYYSVGQSFVPNIGARLGGGVLDPEEGLQHEIGLKHTLRPGLDLTLALYDITKSNIRYRASPTAFLTSGEQQSRGFEATLSGAVTDQLRVIANYAYSERAEVTEDNNPANVGNDLYGVPEHSLNVWGRYDVRTSLPGQLSFGAGVVSVSDRAADNAGSGFDLPGYTRLDLAAFYTLENIDFALNVRNVNDAEVFDTVDGFFVQRQAPRNVMLTARVHF